MRFCFVFANLAGVGELQGSSVFLRGEGGGGGFLQFSQGFHQEPRPGP